MKKNVKKWIIILVAIFIVSALLVLLIFKDSIFKNNVLGETVKLTELATYKEEVKKSKIERIAVLSQSTNFETSDKDEINQILEFLETIKGHKETSEISHTISNTYGVVIYYKDNTNTIINISPIDFSIDGENHYKNDAAYYTTLKKLVEKMQ